MTSTFDAGGSLLTKPAPDGSATSYSYAGNVATITQPGLAYGLCSPAPCTGAQYAIKKILATDVFGNITSVVEQDPANPASGTYSTAYTYDWVNHLTNVSMTRGSTTQQRTFTFSQTTLLLTSATEPETGITTYTYNADRTLNTKTLANGNVLTYTHDSYGRNTGYSGSLSGGGETLKYDANDLTNFTAFTQNAWGRVAYKKAATCKGFSPAHSCVEMYSYTPSGRVNSKELLVGDSSGNSLIGLTAGFTYDNEGRTSAISYPNPGGSEAQAILTASTRWDVRPA